MTPIRPPFTAESARARSSPPRMLGIFAPMVPVVRQRDVGVQCRGIDGRRYAGINDTRIGPNGRRLFSPARLPATAEVPR